jgi:hypothetical protein
MSRYTGRTLVNATTLPSSEPESFPGELQGADEMKRDAGPRQRRAGQCRLPRSWLGMRGLRSHLRGSFDRALGVLLWEGERCRTRAGKSKIIR